MALAKKGHPKYAAQVKAGLIIDPEVLAQVRAAELAEWEARRTRDQRAQEPRSAAPRPRVR